MAPKTSPERADPDPWLSARGFAALLGVLVVAAFPKVVFGVQTFVFRDFGLFSYPIAHYFRERVWAGEIPLWNPLSSLGQPFLAQWNSQVLYPPALFYLLFPLSWSLGMFCLLHLFLGGLGMFFLADRWTGNRLAAAMAGITFAFNGLMLNSVIWPATISGLGWMPWVVWLAERAWREGGRLIFVAAFVGALQMLSGAVEVVLMTWALLGALAVTVVLRSDAPRSAMLLRSVAVPLLITGLCAAQLLPFFDLLQHSHRQHDFRAAIWPMPPTGLGNFLVPLFHGNRSYHGVFLQTEQNWTSSYYVGVITLALAARALWYARHWRVWLLAALTLCCLVLAFGDATPIYRWLSRHVSGLNLMSYPVKFVILPVFALPLLAAFAFGGAGRNGRADLAGSGRRDWILWVVVMGLIALVLGAAYRFPQPDDNWQATWHNGLARALYFTGILGALVLAEKTSERNRRRLLQIALLLLVWLDLHRHAPHPQTVDRIVYRPDFARALPSPQWGEARALVTHAARKTLGSWMFDDPADDYLRRRAALTGNCNLLDDIAKTDGFFPVYLRLHMPIFRLLSDPISAPPSALLDFLGVSRITSAVDMFDLSPRSTSLPLLTGGQKVIFAEARTTVKAMASADFRPLEEVYLPRKDAASVRSTDGARVNIHGTSFAANRITANVEADAPTLIVVAQTYYHPWRAYVDDERTPLLRANYAFQAVEVPAGKHVLELVYVDRAFHAGAAISLATLAGSLLFLRRSSRRSAS